MLALSSTSVVVVAWLVRRRSGSSRAASAPSRLSEAGVMVRAVSARPLERRRRFPLPPLPEPSVLVGLARGVVFRAGFAVLGTLLLGAPFGGILGIVCQS